MEASKAKIYLVVLLGMVLSACSEPKPEQVFEESSQDCSPQQVDGRYLVKWKDGRISLQTATSHDEFMDGFVKSHLDQIEKVERDYRVEAVIPTLVRTYSSTKSSADNWGPERIAAAAAWRQGIWGNDITVAVIDSGVDISHSQLKNQIAYNQGEMGLDSQGRDKSSNGLDDDDNGYVDDYAGYDFVFDSPHVTDSSGHGTHVSGIIAAEHDQADYQKGVVQGVAPGARILPLDFIDDVRGGLISDAIQAIEYAVNQGARIINASWGGPGCSKLLGDKIAELANKNVLFIVAAGNESLNIDRTPVYPAAFALDSQITVGASGYYDLMTDFTNYGAQKVHLFAPGFSIFSTIPGDRVEAFDGTSMSAPFVSGAAALLWSHNPDLTAKEVRSLIFQSVVEDRLYIGFTRGRLNVARALNLMN